MFVAVLCSFLRLEACARNGGIELHMKMNIYAHGWGGGAAVWVLVCLGIFLPLGEATELIPARLSSLAKDGRFDEVQRQLQEQPFPEDSVVAKLITAIEQYKTNDTRRAEKRQSDFDKAMVKIDTFLADGRFKIEADAAEAKNSEESEARWGTLEDAMAVGIDAHSLAKDPDSLLEDQRLQTLVFRMKIAAQQAEEKSNWVEALNFYRLLALLYEQTKDYQDDVKRVARHVRVLQLYVPDELERLYTARAERLARERGLDEPEPVDLEGDLWTDRLRSIHMPMLRQTLRRAALAHVENEGYLKLVSGGIDNLLVLMNTPALAKTFPSLGDPAKVAPLHQHLNQVGARLKVPDKRLNFLETVTILDHIVRTNAETVALPESVIVYEFTEGATGSLDDFTSVIWPEDLEHFSRSTEGNFKGVGIQIMKKHDQLVVVTPLEGTPAQRAGIRAQDIISKVDQVDTRSWSLNKAVSMITGPEKTDVVLEIERPGVDNPIEFVITRERIEIESVRGWQRRDLTTGDGWDYWIDRGGHIGYVRLSQFIPKTAQDLDDALAQMQADGPIHGLILDMRFNPGGLLKTAVEISDRFINDGPIVFTINQEGEREITESAHAEVTYKPFPVVVLINQGSASASEIVAGALQDYSRAMVIGTRSYGKGSVQDLFRLGNGGAFLKLTTQYYMLPLSRIIHRKPDALQWGIEPDLSVEMTNQEVAKLIEFRQEVDILRETAANEAPDALRVADDILAQGLDPQLEAALLVLRTQSLATQIALVQHDHAETRVEMR